MTITHLAWRSARPVQPLRKIFQLDVMLDVNVRDRHHDDMEPLGDTGNPSSRTGNSWDSACIPGLSLVLSSPKLGSTHLFGGDL